MWADRWTISQKLYAAMAALLFLTILEGAVALWGSAQVKADVTTVTSRSDQLQRAQAIHSSLVKMESGLKSLLWAGLDNDRAAYDAAKKASLEEYEQANRLVNELAAMLTAPSDRALAETLRRDLTEWK